MPKAARKSDQPVPTLTEIMATLAAKASPTTRHIMIRHGAVEPLFGVRIGDLKPMAKQLRGRQERALDLFATGNSDAMYLAGLIADGSKMTPRQLDQWAAGATWHMISECSVAWVAAESPEGFSAARRWIDSPKPLVAIAGWSTLAALTAIVPDDQLPVQDLAALLERCVTTIASAPNRVRYAMNQFVIGCGTYVSPLADTALETARRIGRVAVDMGDTACQVPEAASYILKCRRGLPVAPKRHTCRC